MSCSTGVEKFWCHYSLTLHTGFDLLGNINQVVELGPYNFGHSTQQLIHDNLFSGLSGDLLIKSQIFQLLGKLENYWEKVIDSYYKPIHQYHQVLAYINQNLSARIRANEMAQMMSITPQALSRAFKRDIGISLKKYIQNQLNERACTLLVSTNKYIKDIAHELGYEDEYHFSRNFSKAIGKSPKAYRETVKKGNII